MTAQPTARQLVKYQGSDAPRGDLQQADLVDRIETVAVFGAQAATVPPVPSERTTFWHTAAKVLAYSDGAELQPIHLMRRRLVTASRNFELLDTAAELDVDTTSAVALTMVAESSVGWLPGTWMNVNRLGTGAVSIAAGAGVVIVQADAKYALRKTGSPALLARTMTANKWLLVGDLG